MERGPCGHIAAIDAVKTPRAQECEECIKIGSEWMHLRVCQTCGATLCCDSSPKKHMSRHSRATGHAVIPSFEEHAP